MANIALITLVGSVFEEELGISILASTLREQQYHVDIYYCYDKNRINKAIYLSKYDVICFNVFHTNIADIANMSEKIKSIWPTKIVVGGHFAGDNYDIILHQYPCFDYIVIGEAEETQCELMAFLTRQEGELKKIRGIAYRENLSVICTEPREPLNNLDLIPFAARDIAKEYKLESVYIEGARGCSGTCTFCANNMVPYREKSLDRIVDEIHHVIRETGINVFSFTDCSWDNPNNNVDRITALCQRVMEGKVDAHYFLFFKSPIVRITDDSF